MVCSTLCLNVFDCLSLVYQLELFAIHFVVVYYILFTDCVGYRQFWRGHDRPETSNSTGLCGTPGGKGGRHGGNRPDPMSASGTETHTHKHTHYRYNDCC